MFSLAYVSDQATEFSQSSLKRLAEESSEANRQQHITGYLSWKNGRFFQYVEGDEAVIRSLMERLQNDSRHTIVRVLELGGFEERLFPEWGMRFLKLTDFTQIRIQDLLESVMRSMRNPLFDSDRTGKMVEQMVTEVARHAGNLIGDSDSPDTESDAPGSDEAVTQAGSARPPLVIGIGASAGGLRPLQEIFKTIPDKLSATFVVIQHFSPESETVMDSILQRETRMPVLSAQHDMRLEEGAVYVIPPGINLEVQEGKFQLTRQERTARGPQFPIDIFFKSIAGEYGSRAIAVILSGTGSDGSRGVQAIHDADGIVLAQSIESTEFDGMPRATIDTGVALQMLAPFEIAHFIERMAINGALEPGQLDPRRKAAFVQDVVKAMADGDNDFTHYKEDTLFRRIERRRVLAGLDERDEYLAFFKQDKSEQAALRDDLLITVTSFFRDSAVWERMQKEIIPAIANDLDDHDFMRAWVTACATGEEAYSLAMLLTEVLEQLDKTIDFKVYATDIEHRALERAGAGWYSEHAMESMSDERLQRFFIPKNGGYVVKRELRGRVIFAPHNLISDAPFTRMHLVTCRNVLIYMKPELQQQVLKTLHFSLNINGVLLLGSSETLGSIQSEFLAVSRECNVYRKLREFRLPLHLDPRKLRKLRTVQDQFASRHAESADGSDFVNTSMALLAKASSKSAVLIDDNRQTLFVLADPHGLLSVQVGEPSRDLCKMVPPGLESSLTIAIKGAMRDSKVARYSGIRCYPDGDDARAVDLEVHPQAESSGQPLQRALVLLSITEEPVNVDAVADAGPSGDQRLVESLRAELEQTRNSLQLAINEIESSSDAERSTHEQLIASNEELQSTNEELQSVNQELYTVNFEYQSKIHELSDLNHDIDNLLSSTNLGVVFLDNDLRIRRFTDEVTSIVNLLPSDIGRPFTDISNELGIEDLQTELNKVLSMGIENSFRVRFGKSGMRLNVGIHPYRVGSDLAQGVIIIFLKVVESTTGGRPIEEAVILENS